MGNVNDMAKTVILVILVMQEISVTWAKSVI